ncbi:MAG: hypothetical protein EPO24_03580 [Bacteroidetes bacterium]|nr:MAG: hypothetical protein EPO24_03580 [Bacteroidota bacterium]
MSIFLMKQSPMQQAPLPAHRAARAMRKSSHGGNNYAVCTLDFLKERKFMKPFFKITLLSLSMFTVLLHSGSGQESWKRTVCPQSGYVYSLALDSSGQIFAGTGANGVYYYKDNTWKAISSLLENIAAYTVIVDSKGHLFTGTDDGVFVSKNEGERWSEVSNGLKNEFINCLTINLTREIIFAGTGGGGIFRSFDDGYNWYEVNNGLKDKAILSLTTDKNNVIYAGTDKEGVFLSTDNGTTWKQIKEGLPISSILSLTSTASGYVFAGTREGLYRLSNLDKEWFRIAKGITAKSIYALTMSDGGKLYAGTDEGIFRSNDEGITWIKDSEGMKNAAVISLLSGNGGYVYAGTNTGEVFIKKY